MKRLDPKLFGDKACELEYGLKCRIVGQDDAIARIIEVYNIYLAGMSTWGRPVGSFLFLGPTGTGKTRLVESVAEALLGSPRALIKIDCAEFQHSHEIAKLIGSPPGYLGHRETPPWLTQESLNVWQTDKVKLSFVLFDEIEKASDALMNLLLGILDKATLTLGDNRRTDFSNTMVFMTSNLASNQMANMLRPELGFAANITRQKHKFGIVDTTMSNKIDEASIRAAHKRFTPEFMNRIDKTAVFKPLGINELKRILDLELNDVGNRLFSKVKANGQISESAKDFLIKKGTSMEYGARYLKRVIDREIVYPLANLISSRQLREGDCARVTYNSDFDKLEFSKEETNQTILEDVVEATIEKENPKPKPEKAKAANSSR